MKTSSLTAVKRALGKPASGGWRAREYVVQDGDVMLFRFNV